jgi:quercetin dioxygenase-like cupin family protein
VDLFVPPGQGPAPHLHTHEFEVFFVLQGQLSFYVDVEPTPPFNIIEKTVGPGTAVYAPVCRVMGFKNRTNDFGHALTFALPGGIDNGFRLTGDEVVDFTKPPPSTPEFIQEQINRLVFWGDHSGEVLPFFQGQPPPNCAGLPPPVISSTSGEGRPMELGPFGEKRFVLVTPQEAGLATGAVAFCGQTATRNDGGTVKVTSFTMPNQSQPPPPYTSQYYEAFYVIDGVMWVLFDDGIPIQLEPFTYLEIQPGVPFALVKIPGPAPTAQVLAWTAIGSCHK